MQRAFSPFDETEDPRYNSWKDEDETDKVIPDIDGFVTDLIYATRGREVASIYGVWAALFLISSIVQRDAWFTPPNGDPWLDKELLNLYVLFIGPAGCGKTSAVNVVQKIMAGVMREMQEEDDGVMKRKDAMMISNMATPEGFLSALYGHTRGEEKGRRQIVTTDRDGQPRLIKSIANGIALVSEFGSLLSKANYQMGMSTTLLDLYDCPASYKWITVKRGNLYIPEVYFNMLGATTADSISSNVNPTVIEDGFMSRTVMAYVPNFPRERSFRFQTDCSMSDLARRLKWIAKTQVGNYHLSKEAHEYYEQWYSTFMRKMNKDPTKAGYMIRNRTLALKVAVLLKMSDYKPGHTVYIEHLKAAFHVVESTYKEVSDLIDYFSNARIGAVKKAITSMVMTRQAGVTRRQLATKLTRYTAENVDGALVDLWLEGKIIVVNDKGDTTYGKKPEGWPGERYASQRVKHRDPDFDLVPAENVSNGGEEPVPEWDTSEDDSTEVEEESAGNILSAPREWG